VADYEMIDEADIKSLKKRILASGLSVAQLVSTAWKSAASYRNSDRRGGANGARIRLAPQKDWEANEPAELEKVLKVFETLQQEFNATNKEKKVSIADLIVLGGCVAIEKAIKDVGFDFKVPFSAGRTDASQEQTDVESFAFLEPIADGFRNYEKSKYTFSAEELLIDKAQLLTLSAPEMTVLVGGMRALGANYQNSTKGIFSEKVGVLTNDFFVKLLDMDIEWKALDKEENEFEGIERVSKKPKYKASRVDLVFGSNSQLRAIAEVYASDDAKEKFVLDFIEVWNKVMNLDRFDIK
jgi:catalase-peroxidase